MTDSTDMAESTIAPVVRHVTVATDPSHAFAVFTAQFDAWWPRGHHIGEADVARVAMEPLAGGRWYEVGVDGTECDWGSVLDWEPPSRILLRWQLNGQFRFDSNVAHASEIEVTFRAEGSATVVTVEHRGFERSVGGDDVQRGVSSDGGWRDLLQMYKAVVEGA